MVEFAGGTGASELTNCGKVPGYPQSPKQKPPTPGRRGLRTIVSFELASGLQAVGHLAAILGELGHDLLVQPDIHLG